MATPTTPAYSLGLNHSNTYDYAANQNATRPGVVNSNPEPVPWVRAGCMARRRWYPTNTTLNNGNVLVTSGETEPSILDSQKYPELWYNGNWTSLTSAPKALPTYPWMFQAPNGHVFYAGPGPDIKYLDPNGTGAWTETGAQGRTYNRGQGTAAMFWPGRILLVGGSDGQTVTNTAETIDLTSGANGTVAGTSYLQPVITAAAPLRHARHHVNSTILPDGTVLVTGGSRIPASNDRSMGVLDAEIWTPTPGLDGPTGPGTWTTVAPMKEARMYHSTAVLLPDGRVLSAGGEEVIQYVPSFRPNVDNHCTAELYSPPYLFKGARPVISSAPSYVGYGQPFRIQATAGSGTLARATLIRLSSVTHSFNQNQRFLELAIGQNTGGTLTVTAPADGNVCPPGHYLLFVLNSQGVPSEAQVISVGNSTCGATVYVATALTPQGCTAVAQASASGTNTNADYHWSIDGVYDSRYDGQQDVSVVLDACRPQVTFAVEATPTCGGSAVYNFQSVSGGPFTGSNGALCPCGLSD